MLKIHKQKGVSLIELMVAVGLGLTLILSMLAFYSISSQNTIDFQNVNYEQQQIRKMLNLLETNIENTGGFECPVKETFDINDNKYPKNSISLGKDFVRKQIVFVHPITEEQKHTALGIMEINDTNKFKQYSPALIATGCGRDKSNIYIGTTILEFLPIADITTNLNGLNDEEKTAKGITAFVSLSSVQSRRNNQDKLTGEVIEKYYPTMDDATVMFLSNNNANKDLPFGKNEVTIFLGFSKKTPEGANAVKFTHIPKEKWTTLDLGGWINPFTEANFKQLTDGNKTLSEDKAKIINTLIHNDSDADGKKIETYPLSAQAMDQVRAIKFEFKLNIGTDKAITFTRVIRFKNTHLMPLKK